jgi:hypothetical protein
MTIRNSRRRTVHAAAQNVRLRMRNDSEERNGLGPSLLPASCRIWLTPYSAGKRLARSSTRWLGNKNQSPSSRPADAVIDRVTEIDWSRRHSLATDSNTSEIPTETRILHALACPRINRRRLPKCLVPRFGRHKACRCRLRRSSWMFYFR